MSESDESQRTGQSEFVIRRADTDDVGDVIALIATVAGERRWLRTRPPVDVVARTATLQAALREGRCEAVVALRGDDLVGELTLFRKGTSAAIGMCLALDVRGRGLGGDLLDAGLHFARSLGITTVTLDVYAHNAVAIRLYESRGFVPSDVADVEQSDGEVWRVIEMVRDG